MTDAGSSRTDPRSTQGGMRLPPSEAAPARRPGHNVTQLTALQQAIDDAVAVSREVSDQVLAALDTTEAVLASGAAELKERGADAGRLYRDLDGRLAAAATALQAARHHAQDRRAN